MSTVRPDIAEADLVQQLKRRSPEAFETLVSRYGKRLLSVAVRITKNFPEAEDAVQEAMLKVVKSIDNFKEESSLYTWLYRIVANESLMRLRRKGKPEVVPIEPLLPRFEMGQHAEAIADWSELPEDEARASELRQFFEKCVDELPEDHRLPYVLKDIEKLSEDHVCQILRLSKPTMKNRVHRARLAIRKRVEQRFLKKA